MSLSGPITPKHCNTAATNAQCGKGVSWVFVGWGFVGLPALSTCVHILIFLSDKVATVIIDLQHREQGV